MPSQFIKGESEPWNGGRLRKTTAGKWCGEVSDGGKIRRATFETKQEAKSFISDLKARRNLQGRLAMALTSVETKDAVDALHRLEAAGCPRNLCQAVDFFIKHNRPGLKDMTFNAALAAYLEELRNPTDGGDTARPETLRSKSKRLATFGEKHGKKSVRKITAADVSAWVESFGDVAPRTVLNRRAELQSVLNWCEKKLPDFTNTVCKVKQRRKTEAAPAEILTPTQTRALLRAMEKDYPPRYAVSLALMFFAGVRPQELLRPDNPLRWENIRLDEGVIFIPQTASKTRSFRTVPITENLRDWLERYPGEGRIAPSESRFRAARTACKKKARVKKWPPDGARHSYATAAGELHGLHKAAGWMGHSGTLTVFQAHYRGLMNRKDAESFFEIRPAPAAGNVIHLSTEATA
ncbi:MAG: tyrosine-type recombinase/integrase [Verrucomicrobia bacterium]|nr:tyrosine-type recombinase/integrase [Verrucomicrobiota bacterium]